MMRNLMFVAVAMVFTTSAFAQSGTIEVTITGVENTKGQIIVGVYDSDEEFPTYGKQILGAQIKPTKSGDLNYTFKNLPNGTYAIAAWHDENNNEKLDKNLFGAPKEGYGFSKNMYGTFGPPKFEDVSFEVINGKTVELTINLE